MPGASINRRSDFILNADIGVNDTQEKLTKANAVMSMVQASSGGGGQAPDGSPIPQLPIQLPPLAGYEVAKMYLEANGVMNVDTLIQNPEIPPDQAQQALFTQMMQEMQQQVPQMVQQGVQQAVDTANQEAGNAKALAEAAKIAKETERLDDQTDKEAFEVANKLDAEDRREEADVMKAASTEKAADTEEWKAREDIKLRREEMDLQLKIAEKAQEAKATAVVSP